MLKRFIHSIPNIKQSLFSPKRRGLKIVFFLLTTLIVSAGVTYYFALQTQTSQNYEDHQGHDSKLELINVEDHEVDLTDKSTLNVLLLGYGGPGHDGGFLADAIQLAHFDFERQQIIFISIPRDLWVVLPNGVQAKINRSLTLGADRSNIVASGGKVAKKMVKVVTGLEVDYFIAADFVGFKRVIGEDLGGIKVNVPETLEDRWYPIRGEELNPCGKSSEEITRLTQQLSGFELEKQFECRYEHLYFPKGEVKMEGGDALAYVRSRHGSAGGDFSRSQRQQVLLLGIRNKMFKLEFWQNLPSIFEKLQKNITTDIDYEAVEYLLPVLKLMQDFETKQVVLSTENVLQSSKANSGAYILIPREGVGHWEKVHAFIQQGVGNDLVEGD